MIITHPSIILRNKSKNFDLSKDISPILNKMENAITNYGGIGLAAPQIGYNFNIIIIKYENFFNGILPLINPKIIDADDYCESTEGCLSLPGIKETIKRFKKIKISYFDLEKNENEIFLEDMPSIIIQHEIDHCNGILFVDHLPKTKKYFILNKYKKISRSQG